jgi:hypothetical protein
MGHRFTVMKEQRHSSPLLPPSLQSTPAMCFDSSPAPVIVVAVPELLNIKNSSSYYRSILYVIGR